MSQTERSSLAPYTGGVSAMLAQRASLHWYLNKENNYTDVRFENQIFNVLHELLHVAKWKCGQKKKHHGPNVTDDSTKAFNREVSKIYKELLKQKEVFGKYITKEGIRYAEQKRGIR